MLNQFSVGDMFEGVLLETINEDKVSRPRVRPLEYFGNEIRVEFPRHLRENNPIGTRFRANVRVSQKTKNNQPYGNLYLRADENSIIKIENFKPIRLIHAIKLNTASDRTYEYIEKEFRSLPSLIKFEDLRKKAYTNSVELPGKHEINQIILTKRSDLIKTYALSRAQGKCEGCENEAPFIKRNGQPYLEVHHIIELSKKGSDSPLNVVALCPNCHARISHGIDGENFNNKLSEKILYIESQLEL